MSAADISTLRARVMTVLSSPATQKISFIARNCIIDAAAFHRLFLQVANFAFIANPLTGVTVSIGPRRPLAAAEYRYKYDQLVFYDGNYGATLQEKGVILHECIHAIIDTQYHGFPLTDPDNEVAAYVAEALFRMYAGHPIRLDERNVRSTKVISDIANRIASTLRAKPYSVISASDMNALGDAILASPGYRHLRKYSLVQSDGLMDRTPFPTLPRAS